MLLPHFGSDKQLVNQTTANYHDKELQSVTEVIARSGEPIAMGIHRCWKKIANRFYFKKHFREIEFHSPHLSTPSDPKGSTFSSRLAVNANNNFNDNVRLPSDNVRLPSRVYGETRQSC